MGFQENPVVIGGMKRGHTSESSESNRDSVLDKMIASAIPNELALVISTDQGKWFEVKKRKNKKGRIDNIEDYFPSQGITVEGSGEGFVLAGGLMRVVGKVRSRRGKFQNLAGSGFEGTGFWLSRQLVVWGKATKTKELHEKTTGRAYSCGGTKIKTVMGAMTVADRSKSHD
ncbi:hypothetical protein KI387_013218, partial [Taxus chinensis]